FVAEGFKNPLSGLLRRWGVVSGSQQAVLDIMHAPIGGRRKLGSLLFQHVLEQVRNNIDQLHGGFFRVCEPSDRPALRDRLAVRCLHVRENPRRVAHESFPVASISSMRGSASRSFVRSQSGPWPPGKNTLSESAWSMSDSLSVLASACVALPSRSKRRVSSVWKSGLWLFGSSGGWPPFGDASVTLTLASRNTK